MGVRIIIDAHDRYLSSLGTVSTWMRCDHRDFLSVLMDDDPNPTSRPDLTIAVFSSRTVDRRLVMLSMPDNASTSERVIRYNCICRRA